MDYKRHIYITLIALMQIVYCSCSQTDEPVHIGDDDGCIVFQAGLPGVVSRSQNTDAIALGDGFIVTAFCPEDETTIDGSGKMSEYFAEQLVTRTPGMGDGFRSELCRWPENKGAKEGKLKFYAFYPSCDTLRERAGVGADYFTMQNTSTKKSTTPTYKYVMQKFKISSDISRQVDFVIATTEGNKTNQLYTPVNLEFQHQLARVDFKAYGNPTLFDVEIAGIRLGNVNTTGNLDFTQTPNVGTLSKNDYTQIGRWSSQSRGVVEYIYREGEPVIPIKNGGQYSTSAKATSLMGNAGSAFVIPGSYSKWTKSSTNTGLYFSVLLRVKDTDGMQLYPYIEGASMNTSTTTAKMNVVYLAVDKSTGKINKRVYKKEGVYYADEGCTSEYCINGNEEVRDYGWAAFPPPSTTNTTLRSGYQYTYTFNYTSGVGVEDPADALPGHAIITPFTPGVSVTAFTSGGTTDVTDKITIIP